MEGHGKFQGRVERGAEKLEGIIRQRRNILREVAGGGGGSLVKTLPWEWYGYFLEQHILSDLFSS